MAAAAQVKMVTAAVARGHTVTIGDRPKDGARSGLRLCGPGTIVSLPEDEAARLMDLGFLQNPQAEQIPVGEGPLFQGVADGVLRPN